ncbi:hypothetical protein RDV64_19145 [Acuticoccus sp. MNP-M23]|uniref:hypothetical protein n=1 Tax=Acuticoccus sp. MNP-M23 TaxID=3072793 RepID=UPI00281511A0|nr:hypothetical protein [Acuticoccus sp. MNP-M23]WMS42161.1 hypothetical protein RDV64_19145 [Acuticoccus sp. MNP-M23]
MNAAPQAFGSVEALIAGFRAPGTSPLLDDPSVVWFDNEAALFRTDVQATVIQDLRLLSDVALALCSARPTLFLITTAADAAHLSLLLEARTVVLSPYDGVVLSPGTLPRSGFAEHRFETALDWLSTLPDVQLPQTLSAFANLSKADFSRAGNAEVPPSIAAVQHFWLVVGDHGSLAQTVMQSATMIRTGMDGPFHSVTPTLLFVDPGEVEQLRTLRLTQSVAVVAPFVLDNETPVDKILTDFVDARPEPFHVHHVSILGERQDATLGCVYGEYVV